MNPLRQTAPRRCVKCGVKLRSMSKAAFVCGGCKSYKEAGIKKRMRGERL